MERQKSVECKQKVGIVESKYRRLLYFGRINVNSPLKPSHQTDMHIQSESVKRIILPKRQIYLLLLIKAQPYSGPDIGKKSKGCEWEVCPFSVQLQRNGSQ